MLPEANMPIMSRIPSLTLMDSFLAQPTRDDSIKQVESSNWDSYQSGWGDAANVWNDNANDIPGSIIHCFQWYIVQNSDWLTQLNLTILDNSQRQTAVYPAAITESDVPNSMLKLFVFTISFYSFKYESFRYSTAVLRNLWWSYRFCSFFTYIPEYD